MIFQLIIGGALAYFGMTKIEAHRVGNQIQWTADPLIVFHVLAILLGSYLILDVTITAFTM